MDVIYEMIKRQKDENTKRQKDTKGICQNSIGQIKCQIPENVQ